MRASVVCEETRQYKDPESDLAGRKGGHSQLCKFSWSWELSVEKVGYSVHSTGAQEEKVYDIPLSVNNFMKVLVCF